jgi:predicted HTH domain antitoxin
VISKVDDYSQAFCEFLELHIQLFWPREQIVGFCARLLGIELETLRAWLARREDHQP